MKPELDVKRTVKATVGKNDDYDDYGTPGECYYVGNQNFVDHLVFNCPGCGRTGSIRCLSGPKQASAWQITVGSLADPTTLTLNPSIHCIGCCGWHGHLTEGVFKSI